MPRLPLFVSAIAIALLLPAVSTFAASPKTGTTVTVGLELQASNGLRAKLETANDEMVTFEVGRKDRGNSYLGVSYEVQGKVTEAGLKARFGR